MQARDRQRITPKTLETLMHCVSDPRHSGLNAEAVGIVSRTPYGEAWKEHFRRDLGTVRELHVFFSSMLEEEAASFIVLLGACLPDLSKNTVLKTVHHLSEAA